ncbi:hypothetical protein F5Y16DRAFT_392142 [Xylariaceae sp. FL0255]|nr:hypothetical protein F5Y16DRAFT_392142 [Xylariaceae sp. FL0255]
MATETGDAWTRQLLAEIRQLRIDHKNVMEALLNAQSADIGKDETREAIPSQTQQSPDPSILSLDISRRFWATKIVTPENLESGVEVFTEWLKRPDPSNWPYAPQAELLRVQCVEWGGVVSLHTPSRSEFADWERITATWPRGVVVDHQRKPGLRVYEYSGPSQNTGEPLHKLFPGVQLQGNMEAKVCPRLGVVCQISPDWQDESVGLLGLESAAVIFLLNNHMHEYCGDFSYCPYDFLANYATSWPLGQLRCSSMLATAGISSFQFHQRSLIINHERNPERNPLPVTGAFKLRCERQSAKFALSGDTIYSMLSERRYCAAVSFYPHLGGFVVMLLSDKTLPSTIADVNGEILTKKGFQSFPPLYQGIEVFQILVDDLVHMWSTDWESTLTQIEEVLVVKMQDVLEHKTRERLMYDNNKLERSELYFGLLHLFRIFSSYINDSMTDFKRMVAMSRDAIHHSPSKDAQEIMRKNWDAVADRQKRLGEELLGRINNRIAEIESLRDGLFNAQSVRETLRSAQLNRYLFVFTVFTILYLPPSFVATLYATNVFGGTDGTEDTQRRFWITFGSVTGVTYIVAALGLSAFSWKEWWQRFQGLFKGF